MRFRILFIAMILASMSACAPRVLCPAYAIDDAQAPKEKVEIQEGM
ncbi:hypothetical protein OKW21_004327 [Catalinimonas alkaloidigena]|nr:hypothetical protein [Catalinimonas alkaloidigena]MDF9799064.1 hypothetical protein [Catalinimonas alkaloidigena]